MKAYFTASVVGKQFHVSNYRKIIALLKTHEIDVHAEQILGASEETIRIKTKEERLTFMKQLEDWITTCDFLVAEASFPSISVGYEISLALHRGKPVLILYSEGDPPLLIAPHQEDKIVCEKYSVTTLPGIIDDFVNYVRGAIDIRFTFFITPTISSYLDKLTKTEKMPKSVYLRKLIETDMKKRKVQSVRSPTQK